MNDMAEGLELQDAVFSHRVRAAATAAWWVFLVGYLILWVQYAVYLWAIPSRPGWLLSVWGPSFDWSDVQRWWMASIILFKLIVATVAMLALWLTLWARQLRASGAISKV